MAQIGFNRNIYPVFGAYFSFLNQTAVVGINANIANFYFSQNDKLRMFENTTNILNDKCDFFNGFKTWVLSV